MADGIAHAQREMQAANVCSIFYRLPDDRGVLCGEPLDTCALHSRIGRLRQEAQAAVDRLSTYEDEHGDVRDGWVCLGHALDVAKAIMRGEAHASACQTPASSAVPASSGKGSSEADR